MPSPARKRVFFQVLAIGSLFATLGGCSGELYPEAPTPSRSTPPGMLPGATWQTLTDQIQTTSTALGSLTFTPLVRSDDPDQVQFVLTLERTHSSDPASGHTISGTLDIQPGNGSNTRLSLVPSGTSALTVETRLSAGRTLSILARMTVDGIAISGSFTFEAL